MTASTTPSSFLAWLRLLRIPNLPSAISNILMAFLLVNQSWSPTSELILLVLASSALYLAGMVLNDVFDFEIDQRQRPTRPLPARQISRKTASATGFGLLMAGIALALTAGWLAHSSRPTGWSTPVLRTGTIAMLLALLIFLYDGPLKRSWCAPILMGGCRSLNILLGASTFAAAAALPGEPTSLSLFFGLPSIVWCVALAIGVLVTGTTLLGRNEAETDQPRGPLILAGILIAGGLAGFAAVAYCPAPFEISSQQQRVFPLFIGIFSLTIARRVLEAIVTGKPQQIQRGVVSVLRSLIIFDASLCYLAAPDQMAYPLAVLALLIPTLLLGRFIPST